MNEELINEDAKIQKYVLKRDGEFHEELKQQNTSETNVPRRRRRKWGIPQPSMRKAKTSSLENLLKSFLVSSLEAMVSTEGSRVCPQKIRQEKIAVVDPVKMENPYHFVCYKCECRECETSTYLLFATTTYSWVLTGHPCHRQRTSNWFTHFEVNGNIYLYSKF